MNSILSTKTQRKNNGSRIYVNLLNDADGYLQLGVDHFMIKLIWVLLQSFLSQSSKSVLFLVVVTKVAKATHSDVCKTKNKKNT